MCVLTCTVEAVPVQWIQGPGGAVCLPQQLSRMATHEYWVVSWGLSPGVYFTS